jgi:hypothetical protein
MIAAERRENDPTTHAPGEWRATSHGILISANREIANGGNGW